MSDMAFALIITAMALGALVVISLVFIGLSALMAWLGRITEKQPQPAESPQAVVPSGPTTSDTTAPQDRRTAAVQPPRPKAGVEKVVACPMPGTVVALKVRVADSVRAGDVLLVLESMKIRNDVNSPADGEVKAIHVSEGANVKRADRLMTITTGEKSPSPPPVAPRKKTPPAAKASTPVTGGEQVVACPMPGSIVSIKVKGGDQVRAGDVLLVLESMKVQNEVRAPRDGTVKEIHVSDGANVKRGERLVTIA